MKKFLTLPIAAAAVWALVTGAAQAGSPATPTVVELFTSQGCSSCPPADRFLGELATRDDVIALSFHVDYWDYIGWKDPYARAEYSQRQRDYAVKMGRRGVYTPQMVIQGSLEAVGSRRGAVFDSLRQAADLARVPIDVQRDGPHALQVSIPAAPVDGPATVWVVVFDRQHQTDVRRGENTGRSLTNYNVVRDMRAVATWDGKPLTTRIDLPGIDGTERGCAVLVQADRSGRIFGAAALAAAAR